MQKNISLQTLSLALKAENERLKSDNDRLTALVTQLGGDSTTTPGSTGSGGSTRGGSAAGRKRKKVKVEESDDGSSTWRETSVAGSSRNGSRSGSIAGDRQSMAPDESGLQTSPISVEHHSRALSASRSPSASSSSAHPQSFHQHLSPSSLTYNTPSCASSSSQAHSHSHSVRSPLGKDATLAGPSYSPPSFDSCGFCTTNDTPCICRMAAESRDLHSGFSGLLNSDDIDPKRTTPPNLPGTGPSSGIDYPVSTASTSSGGGAVSLPSAYLRRRNSGGGPRPPASIWSLTPAVSTQAASVSPPVPASSSGFDTGAGVAASNSLPECTGDPSACPACADDPFGKAFCETLEAEDEEAATDDAAAGRVGGCGGEGGSKCTNCQENESTKASGGSVELSCCGAPESCGAGSTSSSCVDVAGSDHGAKRLVLGGGESVRGTSTSSFAGSEEPEGHHHPGMVPASTAWRQFKSHPNTTFADLSLLAEVVSRRVPASGHASGSLPPVSPYPDGSSPGPSTYAHSPALSHSSVKLEEEDHHSIHSGSMPPSSRKRRRNEVEVEGVREALRILDARGKRGPNGEILLGAVGLGAVGIGGLSSVAPGVVEVAAGKRGRRMSDLRGTAPGEFAFDQPFEQAGMSGDVAMTAV